MPALPSGEFTILHRSDAEITGSEDHELRRLLLACFPYETILLTRRYVRQSPGQRWLVRSASGELIAHTGLHDKVILVGGSKLRIGGVAEVCVAHSWRGRGLVRAMLAETHAWMEREGIPFSMLFGQQRVYASSDYHSIENPIEAENALLHHWNPFRGKPMIRSIGTQSWPSGIVDLRGPTF